MIPNQVLHGSKSCGAPWCSPCVTFPWVQIKVWIQQAGMIPGEVTTPKHLASCSDFPSGKPKRSPVNSCSCCWQCSPPATSVLPCHLEWKITARGTNPLDMQMSGTEKNPLLIYPLLSMDLHTIGLCWAWGLAVVQKERKWDEKYWTKFIRFLIEEIQSCFVAYFNLISSPQSIGVRKAMFI